jgi:anti-sigma B factor antagonist
MMKMTDSMREDVVVISLSGKILGGDETAYFRGKIYEYLKQNKKRFIIDLEHVPFSNSSGLGMLVAALTSVRREEGRIVLANITNIRTLLAITHLLKVFECYD